MNYLGSQPTVHYSSRFLRKQRPESIFLCCSVVRGFWSLRYCVNERRRLYIFGLNVIFGEAMNRKKVPIYIFWTRNNNFRFVREPKNFWTSTESEKWLLAVHSSSKVKLAFNLDVHECGIGLNISMPTHYLWRLNVKSWIPLPVLELKQGRALASL